MATSTQFQPQRDCLAGCSTEQDMRLSEVMVSVFAAGFGEQSKQNKARDFPRGSPAQFIIAGLSFTVGLLLALLVVDSMIA